jgi:hypothetical protein
MSLSFKELKAKSEIAARNRYLYKAYRKALKGELHERIIFNMIRSNFNNTWVYFTRCCKGGRLLTVTHKPWAIIRDRVVNSGYFNVTIHNHITVKPGVTIDTYIKDMNYC